MPELIKLPDLKCLPGKQALGSVRPLKVDRAAPNGLMRFPVPKRVEGNTLHLFRRHLDAPYGR